jgi:hypothetical protein
MSERAWSRRCACPKPAPLVAARSRRKASCDAGANREQDHESKPATRQQEQQANHPQTGVVGSSSVQRPWHRETDDRSGGEHEDRPHTTDPEVGEHGGGRNGQTASDDLPGAKRTLRHSVHQVVLVVPPQPANPHRRCEEPQREGRASQSSDTRGRDRRLGWAHELSVAVAESPSLSARTHLPRRVHASAEMRSCLTVRETGSAGRRRGEVHVDEAPRPPEGRHVSPVVTFRDGPCRTGIKGREVTGQHLLVKGVRPRSGSQPTPALFDLERLPLHPDTSHDAVRAVGARANVRAAMPGPQRGCPPHGPMWVACLRALLFDPEGHPGYPPAVVSPLSPVANRLTAPSRWSSCLGRARWTCTPHPC